MERNDTKDRFPSGLEDTQPTDSKSQLLLHNEEKRHTQDSEVSGAIPTRSTSSEEINETHAAPPSREVIPSETHRPGKIFEEEEYIATKLNRCFREGRDNQASLLSAGISYSSTTRECSPGSSLAVFLRGTCTLNPTLIGDNHGAVVYEAIDQSERSQLKPVAQCFTENMEAKVPEELVKIELEE